MKQLDLPSKLKSDCINQLDHLLYAIGTSELMGVVLLSKIIDEHLSTPLVFDSIKQLDAVDVTWQSLSEIDNGDYEHCPKLCITRDGKTYLLCAFQDGHANLKRFYKPGEEVESNWIAIDQMVSDLGVLPQVLCVERQEKSLAAASIIAKPPGNSDGEEIAKEHYVWGHFNR